MKLVIGQSYQMMKELINIDGMVLAGIKKNLEYLKQTHLYTKQSEKNGKTVQVKFGQHLLIRLLEFYMM